jgi:hypothetical protein
MYRIIPWGLAAILCMSMVCGCSKTTLSGSWRNPDYLQAVKTIYIVGVSRQETNRRIFEDEFGRLLEKYGLRTFSSYRDLDNVKDVGQDLIMEKVRANGADALLMTRILGKHTEEVVHPARIYGPGFPPWGYYPRPYYRNYWDFYERRYDMIYEPARVTRFEVITLESNLYAAATGELIWSAQLETVMEGTIEAMIRDFIEVVTKDLLDQGVI